MNKVLSTVCVFSYYMSLSFRLSVYIFTTLICQGKKGGLFHGPILYFTLFTTSFIHPIKPQFPNQDFTSKFLSPHLFGPCRKYNYFNNYSCRHIMKWNILNNPLVLLWFRKKKGNGSRLASTKKRKGMSGALLP